MKNLNEPRKNMNEPQGEIMDQPHKNEPDVIPFERDRRMAGTDRDSSVSAGSLIPQRQMGELRGRWTNIQSSFVDEPRKAVQEADQLVRMAIKQIEEGFSAQRSELEKQWSRGDKVSTEDLRVCLQHYRSFFDRLLSNV
jgi:hypothetical protein